jgi:hypothetical protein
MHDGGADATPNAERAARGGQFRRVAERPGDAAYGLTWLQCDQFTGAFAYGLDDQGNCAGDGGGVCDGKRDALRALGAVYDNKLAGLPDLRNARGDYVEPGNVGAELGSGHHVMHIWLSVS